METWLSELKRWIRRLFKGKKKRRNPTNRITQSWHNDNCIVHEIERDIPGAVATYRINRMGDINNYLITLDYLSQLQKDLELERQLASKYNTQFRVRSRQISLTHRFAVFRICYGKSHCIAAWDVDLEGFASYKLSSIAPKQSVELVARSALLIFYDPNVPDNWQFQIEDIDWLFLLRNRIRERLESPHHNLREAAVFPA